MNGKFLYLVCALIAIGVCFAGCASPGPVTPTPTQTTIPPTTTVPATTVPTTTVPSTTTAPATTTATMTMTMPPTTTSPGAVEVHLEARNFAFNLTTITVPAGAQVTIHFENQDAGVPHNFAAYTTSAATTSIFVGQVITGVNMITYTFTAPSTPGNYFFRCDIHPVTMTGTLRIT